jgi:Putative auto-transporter adhesin, head GIN domain
MYFTKSFNTYLKVIFGLSLLFIITVNFSCSDDCNPCSSNYNNSDNSIQGSGNLVSEVRDFPSFNSVHIATAGTVFMTQSDTQSVKVIVDDNLMQYIRLSVANNVLTISIEPNYSLKDMHLTVDINLPELHELHTSSAGNFIGQNLFNCDELRLFSSSAGNIFLNLEADYLYTNLSSAGNANLSGTVPIHDAIISSAGGLHSFNLETDTTTISLNSAGNAEIYVNDLLNATLSSAGSLFYKGSPVINASVSSMGIIVNAN